MDKKAFRLTPVVIAIIAILSLTLTGASLLVAYHYFIASASNIYEEMDRNITAAALSAADPEAMNYLAHETYSIYKSIENPKELFQNDPEAYYRYFADLQNSEEYQDTVYHLNDVRIGTSSTALSYVILMPGEDYCIYIIDASLDNIIPLGAIYEIPTQQYVDQPNKEFDSYISESKTYGKVHTDGFPCCTFEADEIYSYILSDIPVQSVFDRAHEFIFRALGICLLITLVIGAALYFALNRHVLNPLKNITKASKKFVTSYRENQGLNVFEDIYSGWILELQDLTASLNSMEKDMNTYVGDLEVLTEEKTRLSTELKLAESIQTDMLPSIFPAFPSRSEFDLFASMDPAREVGGDFYDFFLVDQNHLALIIADVSGKGIPAALFMMMSKIIVKNYVMLGISPAEVLARVNDTICQNNKNDMFVTIWLGILDIPKGIMTCANAGHEYPIFRKAGGSFEVIKDPHGLVIGSMPGMKYREYEIEFGNEDTLFVYTDGLPEATDNSNQLFGIDRIVETLNQNPDRKPEELLNDMNTAVDTFLQGAPQFDDLTMLAIRGIDIPPIRK